jgi:signal transduction histidine kinase/DNA-binding response OmpR family regulator
MRNWSLARTVLLICLGLGMLVVLQGALSLMNLYRTRNTVNSLNNDTFEALYWAGKLKGVAKDQRIAIVFYMYASKDEDLTKYEAQVAKTNEELRAIRDKYPKFDPRDRNAIATMAVEQAKFYRAWEQLRTLKRAGKFKEAQAVYDTSLMQATLGRRKMEDYLATIDQERGEGLSKQALQAVSTGIPAMWALVLITILLGSVVAVWFARFVDSSNRRLEEEKARADEKAREAEQASIAKSEFLANMSHEIRTPMNGVIGMTGLLLDTELTPEQSHYAETVRSSGAALLSLINNILDFSKIEAKKIDIEIVEFDLQELLDELGAALAPQAYSKGIELFCILEPEVPRILQGDPGRLRQILTNLTGNAVKFTAIGEVVVRAELEELTETDCLLRFSVHDTGIGIPEDKLDSVFDKFSQVDASTTRKFGGTGLGLAIAKQLTEMMGGEIQIKSKIGEGTEFWFRIRLPLGNHSETKNAASSQAMALQGVRILMVDDNATNNEILMKFAATWQMRATGVESGLQALQALALGLQTNDPYQIAILDLQMPQMNGEELGLAIKADTRMAKMPLLILSSLGTRCEWQKLGFAGYLTKPARRDELLNAINMALFANSQPGFEASNHSPARKQSGPLFNGRNVRILIAEDNFTNQQVAIGILKKFGIRADAVGDGEEAVKTLELIPYDLVFMDMRMPVMDGVEATRRIRNPLTHVVNHAIPIIAMTANVQQSDRELCKEAGMNGFISKPLSPEAVREALEAWLQDTVSEELQVAELQAQALMPEQEAAIFDQAGVLQRMMNDFELASLVIDAFLLDTPNQIQILKDSLTNGDIPTAGRLAHSIKGAAANVGGERLRRVAAGMEKAADSGSLQFVVDAMPELEAEFSSLLDAVKKEWKPEQIS